MADQIPTTTKTIPICKACGENLVFVDSFATGHRSVCDNQDCREYAADPLLVWLREATEENANGG